MILPRPKARAGLLLCTALLLSSSRCLAQAQPAGLSSTVAATHADDPLAPAENGPNISLNYTAQHNSATGWANIVQPTLSYRFNDHFFFAASVPWYPTVNGYVTKKVDGVSTTEFESGHNLFGDATASGTFEERQQHLASLLTAVVGFDTGNSRFGLSANTTTYNLTAHADYQLGPFDPEIEIGEGNSSSLANRSVHKAYTAVGPMANFMAGTSVDLPFAFSLDLEAYEDLPIGNQNVYGTKTRKNKKGNTTTTQVLDGTGVAEDNGFNAELDLPIGRHLQLEGTYERSLIQGLDTVGVGLTWTLRNPKTRD